MKNRTYPGALLVALTLILAACGGGGDSDGGSSGSSGGNVGANDPEARGTVVASRPVVQDSPGDVNLRARAANADTLTGAAECGVSVSHVSYVTRDPQGKPATASTGLMVPTGTGANCVGPRPVLLYAHGTTTLKSYDMADPAKTSEALLVEAFYAAHGYIVVAPNYLGYDTSSLTYHPYLNAEVQAGDMVDGLRASLKQVVAAGGAQASTKLFVAGYSQGGHVAMATHKVLERDHAGEFSVTASGPMSGPYDLVQFADTVVSPTGAVNIGATLFMPYLLTSYQNSYGGMYNTPSDAYQPPFDRSAPTLFPTDTPVATLIANGLLPNDPTFRLLFGTGGLLTDSFRAAYPTSNFRAALKTNSVLGWTPKAPVALCGGAGDPTVYFANTTSMRADFASRGVTVPAWNLEDRASLPDGAAYSEVYQGFQLAKLAAGGNLLEKYHGELVPPFCYSLVRGFFAQALAGS